MTLSTRTGFQVAMRAAAVKLLEDYAADADLNLQIYPGRIRGIKPPSAWVDSVNDSFGYLGLRERTTVAEVIVLHGVYDSLDTAAQKDAFMDGFSDYVADHAHAPGAHTLIQLRSTDDNSTFELEGRSYYATTIVLEGSAFDRGLTG